MITSPTIGVVGGGTMGAGIAQVFLGAGCRVLVIETDVDRVAVVRADLDSQIRRAVQRGHLAGDAAALLGRLEVADSLGALAGAELVVEAVPEDIELKLRVLGEVATHVTDDVVIASNTSSMSIGTLGGSLPRPEMFLGMHFFNPVPRSDLVELVRGPQTGDRTLELGRAWVERIGKQVIVVRDSPGFASSRLGIALGMEAIRMVEEGVASAEDIDAAMVLGYRYPMGPLRLTDLVGLDVRLAIAEHLAQTLGERFTPPELLREMVAAGKLGKKSGEGFYRW